MLTPWQAQFKKMYPVFLAHEKVQQREDLAEFDRMVVCEMSLPSCSGCPVGECYGFLDQEERETYWAKRRTGSWSTAWRTASQEERETYWAKRRRRRVRMWRKRMAHLREEWLAIQPASKKGGK